ncbi:MAG: IclR family transcriptional regulator [Actinobacteria bacterium]|nr:IclR family transcriptional regulator [Actinomycetota bacterium]
MLRIARTGVGVLDKSVAILAAVQGGARSLAELVSATGLSRATAYRLAAALEAHGLLAREEPGRWRLGLRLLALGTSAARGLPIRQAALPALRDLAARTGESAQLYVRDGDARVCVEVVESPRELRTIVPLGASLPLYAGSAGKVFLAWADEADRERLIGGVRRLTDRTPMDPRRIRAELARVRQRGWGESVAEREPGVASASVPVLDGSDHLVAVLSVSGPIERTGRQPARRYVEDLRKAATAVEAALGAVGD